MSFSLSVGKTICTETPVAVAVSGMRGGRVVVMVEGRVVVMVCGWGGGSHSRVQCNQKFPITPSKKGSRLQSMGSQYQRLKQQSEVSMCQ